MFLRIKALLQDGAVKARMREVGSEKIETMRKQSDCDTEPCSMNGTRKVISGQREGCWKWQPTF